MSINPFKQLNKLIRGGNKKKKDEQADSDLQKRAFFVTSDNSSNQKKGKEQVKTQFEQSEASLMDFQNQYQKNRIERIQKQQDNIYLRNDFELINSHNDADNYDPERYQSIHENEFKKAKNLQNTDEDDFQILEKPSEERTAQLKNDYQTRLKIERANFPLNRQIYDQSQVNEGHKNVNYYNPKIDQNRNFGEDFVSDRTLSKMDDFDIINVQRNYMDQNLVKHDDENMDFQNEEEKGNNILKFYQENQKLLLEDQDNSIQFAHRTQRSIGFNEFIEPLEDSIKDNSNSKKNTLSQTRKQKLAVISQNDINPPPAFFSKYQNDILPVNNGEQTQEDEDMTTKLNSRDDNYQRITQHSGAQKYVRLEEQDDQELRDIILPLQDSNQSIQPKEQNARSMSQNEIITNNGKRQLFAGYRDADQEACEKQTKTISDPESFSRDTMKRGMSYVDNRRQRYLEKNPKKSKSNYSNIQNEIYGADRSTLNIQARARSEVDNHFLVRGSEKNIINPIVKQQNTHLNTTSQIDQEQLQLMKSYQELLDFKVQNDYPQNDQIVTIDGQKIDSSLQNIDLQNYMLLDFYKEMEINQNQQDDFEQACLLNSLKFQNCQDKESVFDSVDMIRFIDWNERRHRVDAQNQLKSNQLINKPNTDMLRTQKISSRLTKEFELMYINQHLTLMKERDHRQATCVSVSDELILVGNSFGELHMYDRATQEDYEIFKEKGKEFESNAITALAVHPVKPEYILIGYQQGQIILMDLTQPNKPIKTIKDNHKGQQIVNIVFLDQNKEKSESKQDRRQKEQRNESLTVNPFIEHEISASQNEQLQKLMQNGQKQGDLTSWMLASVDFSGRVVITTLTKQLLYIKVQKQILIEPNKKQESKYFVLSSRFKSSLHPQQKINDFVTLLSVANQERIIVFAVNELKSQVVKEILAPKYFLNIQEQLKNIQGQLPSMSWGFCHSPIHKDRLFATLAVSWGPLIQLYILNDVLQQEQVFIEDGYIIMQSEQQILMNNLIEKQNSLSQANPSVASNSKLIQIMEEQTQNYELSSVNPFLQESRFRALSNKQLNQSGIQKTPFEMIELFIEKIEFLSESVLLVLTKTLEIKIFYTQQFNQGQYQPKNSLQFFQNQSQVNQNFTQYQNSQIDSKIFITSLQECDFGSTYQQTMSLYNGMIIGLGVKGLIQFNHVRWDEGLFREIDSDNWILKFQRTVDIFFGNIKGFKDVPEEQFMRQETLKADLKLLIRNIITDLLEQWIQTTHQKTISNKEKQNQKPIKVPEQQVFDNPYEEDNPYEQPVLKQNAQQQPPNPNLDESNEDILENLQILENPIERDQMLQQYKDLIRVSIEFCVIIQDCYFLFYDLFLLFQEDQQEKLFLEELKYFIIAGKFQDYDLPNDILQNHIINYYKDPHQPELLEKVIINLSLKDCPKTVLMELIQFCEENFLSTGIIYLHTAVYNQNEDALCVPALMQLLCLYRKAKNFNPGSVDELRQIINLPPDSIERINSEKSQLYLGYKILWMIRLFLNGKRFPQGDIPEKRWKNYVFELVDRITQLQIMRDLIYIDSEAYFQIMSILFYKGKVFDFINQSQTIKNTIIQTQQQLVLNPVISNDVYEDKMNHFLTHEQILDRFNQVCQSNERNNYIVPDEIRMQYLYFVANVPSKCGIKNSAGYYFSCIRELLDQSQNFLKYNKNLIQKSIHRNKNSGQPQEIDNRYLQLSENALVELMKLCEPMTTYQIDLLLEKTESTKFSFLRMELLNKKQDYVQCLLLFVDGSKNRDEDQAHLIFQFMGDKIEEFNRKKEEQFNQREIVEIEAEFKKQIFKSFKDFIQISPNLTFQFLDKYFPSDQQKFIESLSSNPQEQFVYLDSMFTNHHSKIQQMIERNLMSASESLEEKIKADQYMNLQKLHLRLLCQVNPQRLLDKVRQIKNNEIKLGPQECLEICEQYNQIQACAILSNKMCQYLPSLTFYIKLLTEKNQFNYPLLMKQFRDIVAKGDIIPHFIPYIEKQETQKNKIIMRQADILFHNSKKQQLQNLQDSQLQNSEIIRFDYIIRKALKVCEKEAQENQDIHTDGKLWFFILDQIFEIKSKQITVLKDIVKLSQSEKQGHDQQTAYGQKYEQLIDAIEQFFKSRINFVIEKSLDQIEMGKFLDHLATYDENIKFSDLKEMIHALFAEVNDERVVLDNAYRSAKQQITSSLQNQVFINSFGLVFQLPQCYKCNKYIDDEIRDLKKRKELMNTVRKGTFISKQGYQDDDFNDPYQPQKPENIRLYECGHAFHNKCIFKIIQEKQVQLTNNNKSVQNQTISKKLFSNQKCPWCFSDRFKIDFETLFKKDSQKNNTTGRQIIKMGTGNNSTRASDSHSEIDEDEIIFDGVDDIQARLQQRQLNPSRSLVKKQIKSVQEQKLQMFDFTLQNEGVTIQNFKFRRF